MSSVRRVLVLGTGTGVGKTEVTAALVRSRANAVGLKPIESGLSPEQLSARVGADAGRIRGSAQQAASGLYLFLEPVSPHLAARLHGVVIDPGRIAAFLDLEESSHPESVLVVESAGGAFSPLGPDLFNADLPAHGRFDRLVLVASNRLGVLHDVFATCVALQARSNRTPDCIVLNDASTDEADPTPRETNLRELVDLGRSIGLGAVVRFPHRGVAEDALPIWSALSPDRGARSLAQSD